MEWVETTGRSVEEAKEAALDELGVDEADAEFEVIAETQTGLFGRVRSEARVRAHVRPTAPRAKEDRRDRRRRSTGSGSTGSGSTGSGSTGSVDSALAVEVDSTSPAADTNGSSDNEAPTVEARPPRSRKADSGPRSADVAAGQVEPRPERSRSTERAVNQDRPKGSDVEVALEEQARIAEEFLTRLAEEFDLEASIKVVPTDEESMELQITGPNLGLLIGQKGSTLVALQSLTRTVVQHKTGATNGHINVDVGGYRQKRTEALVRFANQVAGTVVSSGKPVALEPMSAVDRKIVHDTVGAIPGVGTSSEGEEPQRRVVVSPAPAEA